MISLKIFTYYQQDGRIIDRFDSKGAVIHPLVKSEKPFQIGCMYLERNSVLGMHEAMCPQLFIVTDGSGWVRVEGGEKIPVEKGTAVFWDTGENHESGSDTGMTAIVAEGEEFDPERFLGLK
ncbi:cupin domain-containing protein [Rossellomorea vietnamensis]|uniref:cupin domain-containing protein n=1 Tax=Rossellomorea TaxID=2837508 RepID=UPI00292A3C4A|nr:cupin [Rossellomorea aquimaris]